MNREGHRKDHFGFYLDEGFLSLSIFIYILFFMKKVLAKIFCPLHLETLFFSIKKKKKNLFWILWVFRYKVGQCFGQHYDAIIDLGEGKSTRFTLLVYLNGGPKPKAKNDLSSSNDHSSEPLVGGETVFYDSRNAIVAEVNSYVYCLFCPTFFALIFFFLLDSFFCYMHFLEYAL